MKILLVEDNPDDRELMLRALQRRRDVGAVITAGDGVEALRVLDGEGEGGAREEGAEIVLVLLDLKLPGIGGLEILQRMRADPRTRRIPVVVLSTSDEESDIAACYDGGANSYVQKPVDYSHFVELVARIDEYWLTTNVNPP